MLLCGKRNYAGGLRVLEETKERISLRAGAEAINLVTVKKGVPSKATANEADAV
jgi:hypothetical protein